MTPADSRGVLALCAGSLLWACDKAPTPTPTSTSTSTSTSTAPAEPMAAPRPPDIIIDSANVAVGPQRVPVGEPGLVDKVGLFVGGQPAIPGQTVDFVAMRNAKPSQVVGVSLALRRAKASGVNVKSEARDGSTQALALSFALTVPDCTTVAWIAKDAAIDVWPAGGGTAKRVIKGMAGPDMTLGTEAVEKNAARCAAPELLVGADDRLTWGLVFDLATMSMHMPAAHVSRAVLVTNAVPGRRVTLEAP